MANYVIRRLLLIPLTIFFIILVNFVIINLAPGDPTTVTEVGQEGAIRRGDQAVASGSDDRYLQFREFYGLTLPILFNTWPWIHEEEIKQDIWRLIHRKETQNASEEMSVKDIDKIRIRLGDQARFVMPQLLGIIEDKKEGVDTKKLAARFFIRGGSRQAILGPNLSDEEKKYNRKIEKDNLLLKTFAIHDDDTSENIQKKAAEMKNWMEANSEFYNFKPTVMQKLRIFFFENRFCKYMSRVLTLDFGTLRNDSNKTVINEVVKRFKYSLTLSIVPLLITFILCQVVGFTMAVWQHRWPDYTLNILCLILYAIPIFVVAPFLIEQVALNRHFPFTNIPIPFSGFTSPDSIYLKLNSLQRLFDIMQHLFLPLIAILYGSLAAQSRLSRTAVLEVMRQDYVRTAWAKGVSPFKIMLKHIGRNASITIVTSIAGSLGVVLGGSLIVETLFEINGFGKFFYDAIINRDYNVIMFSAISGSILTLLGYLAADLAYTVLDPRVTLE